ncbi:insulin-like growth factor-binding protein 7 [Carlito syrichta]|uniref:Insulin-like growth factor-binding protein 7 n=1 Tax=Carlito syrichta TaxID=1868482 RepID=A0A3Q0DJY2_CARSF|nr:insulin-like growth factor-binding protein 7 [Carlito syrichta]
MATFMLAISHFNEVKNTSYHLAKRYRNQEWLVYQFNFRCSSFLGRPAGEVSSSRGSIADTDRYLIQKGESLPPPTPERRSKSFMDLLSCEAGLGRDCLKLVFGFVSPLAGPSIVTPPRDIWNVTGAQVYLSCEVIGIPTPVLIWNKVKRGHYGVQRTELLPGDRDNLAIQTRGGPEKHEVTGWVLVSPLSKEDAGEYECHASNSQGQASASAKITVVDALHEIPVKKGEGAEL